jgi:PAS domain S-box-containing protein
MGAVRPTPHRFKKMPPLPMVGAAVTSSIELFDLLLAATNDGVIDWEAGDSGARYSDRWKALLGYEPHELADSPTLWRELSHPADLPGVEEHLQEHRELQWPFHYVWRLRHKHETWRWLLCRAVTLQDGDNRPVRSMWVFTDVTDAMHTQERHRALARAMPDLILWIDRDGNVLETGPGQGGGPESLRGLRPGQKLTSRMTPPSVAKLLPAVRDAIAGQSTLTMECDGLDSERLQLRIVRSGDDEALLVVRAVPLGAGDGSLL